MTWAILIGIPVLLLVIALRKVPVGLRERNRFGLLKRPLTLGRWVVTTIGFALCAVWFLASRESGSTTDTTPEILASQLRAGPDLPRRVGTQVRLERVVADGASVILAHVVDVSDDGALRSVMANVRQWDGSGLCDAGLQARAARAGIAVVAEFRTRNGRGYRSLTVTPAACGIDGAAG